MLPGCKERKEKEKKRREKKKHVSCVCVFCTSYVGRRDAKQREDTEFPPGLCLTLLFGPRCLRPNRRAEPSRAEPDWSRGPLNISRHTFPTSAREGKKVHLDGSCVHTAAQDRSLYLGLLHHAGEFRLLGQFGALYG